MGKPERFALRAFFWAAGCRPSRQAGMRAATFSNRFPDNRAWAAGKLKTFCQNDVPGRPPASSCVGQETATRKAREAVQRVDEVLLQPGQVPQLP